MMDAQRPAARPVRTQNLSNLYVVPDVASRIHHTRHLRTCIQFLLHHAAPRMTAGNALYLTTRYANILQNPIIKRSQSPRGFPLPMPKRDRFCDTPQRTDKNRKRAPDRAAKRRPA